MKKITAIAVALAMVLTMIPTMAFADTQGNLKCCTYWSCGGHYDTLEEAFENCREIEVTEDTTLDSLYLPLDASLIVPEGVSLEFTSDAEVNTGLRSEIVVEKGASLRLPKDMDNFIGRVKFHAESTIYNAFGPAQWTPDPNRRGYYERTYSNVSPYMFNTHKNGEHIKEYYERVYGVDLDIKYKGDSSWQVATGEPRTAEEGAIYIEGLTEGEDYVIKYWHNTKVGMAERNVIGIGKYEGFYESKELQIFPPKGTITKVTSKKTTITVTAKDTSEFGTTSYSFKYRKAGSSKWVTVNNKTKNKWTFKKLKKNTKYYIRVAGCYSSDPGDRYRFTTGEWSNFKSIRTKR